jgi:hypothetical protein
MGRTYYIPESDKIWLDFYMSQAMQKGYGGGFTGIPYQRGHGLGSFFGRLFRSILPVAKSIGKSALKTVGKEAVNMGMNVAQDLSEGRNIRQSLKEHGAKAVGKLVKKGMNRIARQSGSGLGKQPVGSKNRGSTTLVVVRKRKPQTTKRRNKNIKKKKQNDFLS